MVSAVPPLPPPPRRVCLLLVVSSVAAVTDFSLTVTPDAGNQIRYITMAAAIRSNTDNYAVSAAQSKQQDCDGISGGGNCNNNNTQNSHVTSGVRSTNNT